MRDQGLSKINQRVGESYPVTLYDIFQDDRIEQGRKVLNRIVILYPNLRKTSSGDIFKTPLLFIGNSIIIFSQAYDFPE